VTFRVDRAPDGSLTYRPSHPVDIGFATMGTKTIKRRSGVHWWTTHTPQGPAVVAMRAADGCVRADGWGPGLDWPFTQLPSLLGARDDPSGFEPAHTTLAAVAGRFTSLRIGATGRWYEALATSAIGQRVVTADAGASRSMLARRHGEATAAGPANTFPAPETILTLTDHELHRAGIERSRARVLRVGARYADRLERLSTVGAAEARAWLQELPGVGPWTAALTTSAAGGDADAVPVGDLHIPRIVTYALTGEEGDDEPMLEALAPYDGHRMRVVRMLKMSGAGPPRHRPAPFRYDITRI